MTYLRRWLKRLVREAVRDELVRAGQAAFDEPSVLIGEPMNYRPPFLPRQHVEKVKERVREDVRRYEDDLRDLSNT